MTHPVLFFFLDLLSRPHFLENNNDMVGPILTNAHPYTAYLWYALAMFDTCRVHSGYKFLGASRHDDHHNDYFNYNFGNRFMDTIGGTMAPPPRSSSSSKCDDNTSNKKSD